MTAAVGLDAISQGRRLADLILLLLVFGKEAITLPWSVVAGHLDDHRLTRLSGHDKSGVSGGDGAIRSRTSMHSM
jgi:hypothetical protein